MAYNGCCGICSDCVYYPIRYVADIDPVVDLAYYWYHRTCCNHYSNSDCQEGEIV